MPLAKSKLPWRQFITLVLILQVLAVSPLVAYAQDNSNNENKKNDDAEVSSTKVNYAPLDNALDRARKQHNSGQESDALYDLAKAHFDNKDFSNADTIMRQALLVEETLKRPASNVRINTALALILVAESRESDALACYDQAIAQAQKNALTDELGSLAVSKSSILMTQGKLDDAEATLNQALNAAKAKKDIQTQGSALINLAVIARAHNQLDKAESLLQSATEALKEHADGTTLGNLLMELGKCQSDQGHMSDALTTLGKAQTEYEGDFNTAAVGKVMLAVGQIQLTEGKSAQAQETLEKARTTLKAEGQSNQLIDCDTALAEDLAEIGNLEAASNVLKEALALLGSNSSPVRKRMVLSQLGYLQLLNGKKEDALSTYLEAEQLSKQAGQEGSKSHAVLLSDIALVYKSFGQTQMSISYLEKALPIFKASGDKKALATAVNNLAVAYLDSGNTQQFDQLYATAKTLFSSLPDTHSGDIHSSDTRAGDTQGLTILTYNLAQYKIVRGQFAEALPLYEQCLQDLRGQPASSTISATMSTNKGASDTNIGDTKSGDSKMYRQILAGLGLAYLLNGQTEKSLSTYQAADKIANQLNDLEAKWDCQLGLGKCYRKLGNLPEAYTHLQSAVEIVEKERSQLTKDSFKTYSLDLRQDCFAELIDLLVAQNKVEDALVVAERGRARAFLDMLQGRHSKLPASLEAPETIGENQAEESQAKESKSGTNQDPSLPTHGPTKLVATFDYAQSANAAPPDLSQIKNIASKQKAYIIEYYLLPEKLLTWVISPDGQIKMAPIVLKKHSLWSALAAEAYLAITTRPKDFTQIASSNLRWTKSLQNLYQLLITPLEPLLVSIANQATSTLPNQILPNLIIVPHGPLFSIPFAALLDAKQNYLIEKTTLSYVPAIGVLKATADLAQAHKNTPEHLLAFGNPINANYAALGQLPFAQKEVEQVSKEFGTDKSQVFIGKEATADTLSKYGGTASVIHLASHGLINETSPLDSGLVLSPSATDSRGLLTARDILAMPTMNCKLAVLSACQSGRGRITGDGVVGLSRAFIIAGAPSVLVSQWNVDDAVTQVQMVSLYNSYLHGTKIAEALNLAQRKTITLLEGTGDSTPAPRSGPRANPRLWAAFQLIGEGYSANK